MKYKTNNKYIIFYSFFLLFLIFLIFNNCSQLDNDSSTSTVTIPLIGNNNPNNSFAGAPANTDIDSFTLTVTGSGMGAITETYPAGTTSIEIEVPSGNNREFSLTVDMDPDSSSAVLSWLGTATADLAANETAVLSLNMAINETKIIMPHYLITRRLIMMNSMNGDYWKIFDGSSIGYGSSLYPNDIDFDNQGRIYIANGYPGSMWGRAIRIDDFDGNNFIEFSDRTIPIVAVAVDRINNNLYYASSSSLWKTAIDGTGDGSPALNITGTSTINSFLGMSIDSTTGMLYIAGTIVGGAPTIFKYNTITETVIDQDTTNLNDAWDTLVKDGFVYIANMNGSNNYKILQLDTDLNLINNYGLDEGDDGISDTSQGAFYGPRRFVAVLNRKITVIDDHDIQNLDKVISMDDIDGNGWETYPASGDGQSLFSFFYVC